VNAATQIAWGLGYIRRTYGDHPPMTAMPYANGGILPHGPTIARNAADEPELIKNAPCGGYWPCEDADGNLALGPLPAQWVCSYCKRNPPQHERCTDPLCSCCEGNGG